MSNLKRVFMTLFLACSAFSSALFAHGDSASHLHPHGLETAGLALLLFGALSFATYGLVRKIM